jgi:hypothetical protein
LVILNTFLPGPYLSSKKFFQKVSHFVTMANSSGHLVWVLSPELENWDLQFRLRATEYRINLTAGRIALRMGDLVSHQRHLRFNVGIRECIEDLYDEANAKLSSTLKTEPQGFDLCYKSF